MSKVMISIVGCTCDSDVYFCRTLAEKMEIKYREQDNELKIQVEILLEIDYIKRLEAVKVKHGGQFYSHKSLHFILLDGEYLGDRRTLIELAKEIGVEDAETDFVMENIHLEFFSLIAALPNANKSVKIKDKQVFKKVFEQGSVIVAISLPLLIDVLFVFIIMFLLLLLLFWLFI